MKKLTRTAALAAVLCLSALLCVGCRNEAKITKNLEVIRAGGDRLAAMEAGEILVYESVKLAADVEGLAENSVTESYAKFVGSGEDLQYDLGATKTYGVSGEVVTYNARQVEGIFMHALNGEALTEEQMPAPDIFDRFRVDYTAADVQSIETVSNSAVALYAVEMTDAYVNSFDTALDGASYDCTSIVYNYYFDTNGALYRVMYEETATLTDAAGEAQEVTRFSDATAK